MANANDMSFEFNGRRYQAIWVGNDNEYRENVVDIFDDQGVRVSRQQEWATVEMIVAWWMENQREHHMVPIDFQFDPELDWY